MKNIKTFESLSEDNNPRMSTRDMVKEPEKMTNIIYDTLLGGSDLFDEEVVEEDEINGNVIKMIYAGKKYTITVELEK